jgi:hypothetical protein
MYSITQDMYSITQEIQYIDVYEINTRHTAQPERPDKTVNDLTIPHATNKRK